MRAGRSTSRTTTSTSRRRRQRSSAARSRPRTSAGVAVRIVYNVDHRNPIPVPPPPEPDVTLIAALGVPHKGISGIPDLMHHKYVIRDGESVWTGSLNWTDDSFTVQENVGRDRRRRRGGGGLHGGLRADLDDARSSSRPGSSSRRTIERRRDGGPRLVHAGERRGSLRPHRPRDLPGEAARPDRLAGDHDGAGARRARAGVLRGRARPRRRGRPDAAARRRPRVAQQRQHLLEAAAPPAGAGTRIHREALVRVAARGRHPRLHAREGHRLRRHGVHRELQPVALRAR